MLKRLAIVSLLALTGCAYHPQYQPGTVYIEQQVINPNRHAQCEIYLRRYANCRAMSTTYNERVCQNNEMAHYNSCMYR